MQWPMKPSDLMCCVSPGFSFYALILRLTLLFSCGYSQLFYAFDKLRPSMTKKLRTLDNHRLKVYYYDINWKKEWRI